jgi:hypothetical protein
MNCDFGMDTATMQLRTEVDLSSAPFIHPLILEKSKATRFSIALGIAAFMFLAIYTSLFHFCIVKNETRGTAYYPLWTSGQIARMIESAGSRQAAIDKYGIAAVDLAIHKMPDIVLIVTSILLLLFYQAVFTSLATAFGILGFQKGKSIWS